jgi:HEAT repeat protein
MSEWGTTFEHIAIQLLWIGLGHAGVLACAVVVGRLALTRRESNLRRVRARYEPLVDRALAGDESAIRSLVASPKRYRVVILRWLMTPVFTDRDPARIAAVRAIAQAMAMDHLVARYLRSRFWWRRALALRSIGMVQSKRHTAAIVAALDDPRAEVRNAALDALADLQDPAALPAIVVRLHDPTFHAGRREAALLAFGSQAEVHILDLARIDPEQRVNYAWALAICGTDKSRPLLREWTTDERPQVRVATFEALGHVGLDEAAAALAVSALDSSDVRVRVAAAGALRGWNAADAAARLAGHLDDVWVVAVRAARSLDAMGPAGHAQLERCAVRSDLPGLLARDMLWQPEAQL